PASSSSEFQRVYSTGRRLGRNDFESRPTRKLGSANRPADWCKRSSGCRARHEWGRKRHTPRELCAPPAYNVMTGCKAVLEPRVSLDVRATRDASNVTSVARALAPELVALPIAGLFEIPPKAPTNVPITPCSEALVPALKDPVMFCTASACRVPMALAFAAKWPSVCKRKGGRYQADRHVQIARSPDILY